MLCMVTFCKSGSEMQFSPVQWSAVKCRAVQCSAMLFGFVQCSIVLSPHLFIGFSKARSGRTILYMLNTRPSRNTAAGVVIECCPFIYWNLAYMGRFCMTVNCPNPGLFFFFFRFWQFTVTFSAYKKDSDQLLSHHLKSPSQASQLIGLKQAQIIQLSQSQIRLGRLI